MSKENLCETCFRDCPLKNKGLELKVIECASYLTSVIDIDAIEMASILDEKVPDTAPTFNHVNPTFGELVAEMNLRGLEMAHTITHLREFSKDMLAVIKEIPDGPIADQLALTISKHLITIKRYGLG